MVETREDSNIIAARHRRSPSPQNMEDEESICLDASFFVNRNYELTTFTFGPHVLRLFCLQSACSDYDLTGQLVWPGAMLLNDYLARNSHMLEGCTIIELGSGIGVTGILCSRFCPKVVLTDHNDEVLEILKRNVDLQTSFGDQHSSELAVEKLEWGDLNHLKIIQEKYPKGFDLIVGADICFQQSSISPLFSTVEKLLHLRGGQCRFILAYVSRAKSIDTMVINEALQHGMHISEVHGTRSQISNHEGVIYEISLVNHR